MYKLTSPNLEFPHNLPPGIHFNELPGDICRRPDGIIPPFILTNPQLMSRPFMLLINQNISMSGEILAVFFAGIDGIILEIILGLVETVPIILLQHVFFIDRRVPDFLVRTHLSLVLLVSVLGVFVEALDVYEYFFAVDFDTSVLGFAEVGVGVVGLEVGVDEFGVIGGPHARDTVEVVGQGVDVVCYFHTFGLLFFL